MGSIFKKQSTRPVPSGATITGNIAKWKGRGKRLKWVTSTVVTLPDGRQVIRQQSATYFCRYRDHDGTLKTISTGCRDRSAAESVLREHERRAERIKAGIATPTEYASGEQQKCNIGNHVEAYVGTFPGGMHSGNTRSYLLRLVADCKWSRLLDLRRSDLEQWIAVQSKAGRSARSKNAYQTAIVSFCNWCVRDGRMTSNPFNKMAKANLEADHRRQRRALTPEEMEALIRAAQNTPERVQSKQGQSTRRSTQRLSGRDRADLYRFLAGTGLRVGEAKQLRVAYLDLDSRVPTVRLSAATTKNGKEAVIPLRADLVEMLRARVTDKKPSDPVFDIPSDLIKRFHGDCKRAGIARRDGRGRQADLHCLRLTFGTNLARAGVPMRTAQQLMRHSDINLTARVYVDPALLDLHGAVEAIASLPSNLSSGDGNDSQPESPGGNKDVIPMAS